MQVLKLEFLLKNQIFKYNKSRIGIENKRHTQTDTLPFKDKPINDVTNPRPGHQFFTNEPDTESLSLNEHL